MTTNPEHINQLAAIIREVDGLRMIASAVERAEAILSHPGWPWQPPAALAQPQGEGPRELQCPASVARGCHEAAAEAESGSPLQQLLVAAGDLLAQPEGEGPSLADIGDLCEEHSFNCDDGESIEILHDMIGAALARWGRPAALPAPPAPAPEHAGGSINDEQREAVRAAVAEALGGAYDCIRVWEAWNVRTMGPDDFVLVAEDDDRVAEIADAAIEAMRPAAAPAPLAAEAAGEGASDDAWWHELVSEIARVQHVAAGEGQGPRFDLAEAVVRWCHPTPPPTPADRLARWGRPAAPTAGEVGEGRWSEGVCGDGAAILFDGVMVPIEEVVRALNRTPAASPAPEEGEVEA
jgi:hypothetical protein